MPVEFLNSRLQRDLGVQEIYVEVTPVKGKGRKQEWLGKLSDHNTSLLKSLLAQYELQRKNCLLEECHILRK